MQGVQWKLTFQTIYFLTLTHKSKFLTYLASIDFQTFYVYTQIFSENGFQGPTSVLSNFASFIRKALNINSRS